MRALWAAILGLACGCAQAQRVLDFHSEIRVGRDGVLTVTEILTLEAGHPRGLRRLLPVRRAELLSVTRNGAPAPYALESMPDGLRLELGRAAEMPAAGRHEYRILYRATRQVGFGEHHDELAWELKGGAWRVPVERMSAEVRFAEAVPAAHLQVAARAEGAGRSYQAFVRAGSAAFRATRSLAPGDSFTISVGFPKGLVAPPSRAQRFDAWAEGHPMILAGLGGLVFAAWWFEKRSRR